MRISLFLVATLVFLLPVSSASAQSRDFSCDDGSLISVTVLDNQRVRAGPIQGEMITLRESSTEKWYFLKGDYGVRISPDQARLKVEIPDFGVVSCVYQTGNTTSAGASTLPHAATSWGGSVRSGPGTNYKKVGSLSEGERITILEQSSAPLFQGRPWFKIKFDGRTGYHWGGIICPLGEAIPGTYKVCNEASVRKPAKHKKKTSSKKTKPKTDTRSISQRCKDNREGCNIGVKEACRNLARWGC